MKSLHYFLILPLLLTVSSESPNARFFVPLHKLDTYQYLSVFLTHINNATFPDFQLETHIAFVPVTVSVSEIRVKAVVLPNGFTGLTANPLHRVEMECQVMSLVISFRWAASYVNLGGHGEITIENTKIHVSFLLGHDQGRLTIVPEVFADIGTFQLNFEESALSWLYEIILKIKGDWLKTEVKRLMLETAEREAIKLIEKSIGAPAYPTRVADIWVDFSLVHDPVVNEFYVIFDTRGTFFNASETMSGPNNHTVATLPAGPSTYSLEVAISQKELRAWMLGLSRAGETITGLFPFHYNGYLRLSVEILDQYIPGLYAKYGERDVYIRCQLTLEDSFYFSIYEGPHSMNCELRFVGVDEPFGTIIGTTSLIFDLGIRDYLLYPTRSSWNYPITDVWLSVPELSIYNQTFNSLATLISQSEGFNMPGCGFRLPNIPNVHLRERIQQPANEDFILISAESSFRYLIS